MIVLSGRDEFVEIAGCGFFNKHSHVHLVWLENEQIWVYVRSGADYLPRHIIRNAGESEDYI